MTKATIIDTDNRGLKTTILEVRIPDIRNTAHVEVEVDPVELFFNAVENLYDVNAEERDQDTSDLEDFIDHLNGILKDYTRR